MHPGWANKTLILPLPSGDFFKRFADLFPFEIYAGGMHELVLSLLVADSADQFSQVVIAQLEDNLAEIDDAEQDPQFTATYQTAEKFRLWDAMLNLFYEDYSPVIDDILGGEYPTDFICLGYGSLSSVHILINGNDVHKKEKPVGFRRQTYIDWSGRFAQ